MRRLARTLLPPRASAVSGGRTVLGVALGVLAASCGSSSSSSPSASTAGDDGGVTAACSSNPVAQSFNAGLTFYSQTGQNNCQIPWPSSSQPQSGTTMYTAISTNLYDDPSGSDACGKCVQVNGQTLLVVDQCPNDAQNPLCATNHLDLGGQATFQTVSPGMSGEVPNDPGVAVNFVPCPVSGNLQYSFASSSQQYYVAMVVLNSRYGIQGIEYRATGSSSWTAMGARSDMDPNWTINGVAVPNPIDFRVTDEWGQVLEDDDVMWSAGNIVNGNFQFPSCN
jgi:hypothetical protein